MTTATLTEADVRVRDAVMRQLDWDPEVDAAAVGAAAKSGTVTLSGFIDTYSGKLAAERAAKRVRGDEPSPTTSTFAFASSGRMLTSPWTPSTPWSFAA